jgi:predicted AAA+ superfamily ATPase
MVTCPRLYSTLLKEHFLQNRQMAFVSGPRQVGKTTCCRLIGDRYLTWDNTEDRRNILAGTSRMANILGLEEAPKKIPVVVFDELHKYAKWKSFLKGFFDTYENSIRIAVTGSSRLNLYRRGSDSLMGRYFLFRMHPLSVAEIMATDIPADLIRPPQPIGDADWKALNEHGGFPEPFFKRNPNFTRRWRASRADQLSKEDLREITRIEELGTLEVLMQLLAEHSSQQLIYSNYAAQLGVTPQTIKRWVNLLNRLHYGFSLTPWFNSVARALRKEPKWFLRDWSGIADVGARAETFVACHLLKAVEGWTDMGLGEFELRYIRTATQEEVDFVIIRDRKPWVLIEVKQNKTSISRHLYEFQKSLKAEHAFQVVMDLPYVQTDCFSFKRPIIVPARTFLSQLL